jgi:hypothetical protein
MNNARTKLKSFSIWVEVSEQILCRIKDKKIR